MSTEPETYLGRVTFAIGALLDAIPAKKRADADRNAAIVAAWINDAVDLLRGLKQGHRSLGGSGWWVDTELEQRLDALVPPIGKEGGQQ